MIDLKFFIYNPRFIQRTSDTAIKTTKNVNRYARARFTAIPAGEKKKPLIRNRRVTIQTAGIA